MTRILVNSANIESRILADTRLEAQRCLEKLPKGGTAYTRDGFLVRVFPCVVPSLFFSLFFFDEDVVDRDGISSTPLDIKKSNDSSSLMLTGRDTVGEIQ